MSPAETEEDVPSVLSTIKTVADDVQHIKVAVNDVKIKGGFFTKVFPEL